ncbi:MAG: type II toxin-antitoxin system HicA family toxin [Methanolobus sp.]|nr:type II toxin-antitoxin system HicA family toxin [Methanolobus sp.]
MTKFPILSAREVIKTLENAGFQVVSQKGSHIKMKKKKEQRNFCCYHSKS